MTVRLLVIVQTWWDVTIISRIPGNLHISYLGCATFNDLELKGRLVKRLIITSCAGVFRPNEPLQQLREYHRWSLNSAWKAPGFWLKSNNTFREALFIFNKFAEFVSPSLLVQSPGSSMLFGATWQKLRANSLIVSACGLFWPICVMSCH